jgi:hypothetical protein
MRDIPKPIPEKPVRFISIIDGKGGKHRTTLLLSVITSETLSYRHKKPGKSRVFFKHLAIDLSIT